MTQEASSSWPAKVTVWVCLMIGISLAALASWYILPRQLPFFVVGWSPFVGPCLKTFAVHSDKTQSLWQVLRHRPDMAHSVAVKMLLVENGDVSVYDWLRELNNPATIRYCIKIISDDHARQKAKSVVLLNLMASIGGEEALSFLLSEFDSRPYTIANDGYYRVLVSSLGRFPDPRTLERLTKVAVCKEAPARFLAMESLAAMHSPGLFEFLCGIFDQEPDARWGIFNSCFRQMTDPRISPFLGSRLNDFAPSERNSIASYLEERDKSLNAE